MSLSIVGNSALLFARQNLGATQPLLNSSLQQLSTGLKIDPVTEPFALSPQLDSITSSNTAVDAVQTADGALGEINRLLNTIKAFAINSANAGANDSTTRESDQRQISNALAAINSLTQTTLAGNINLFAGGNAAGSSARDVPPGHRRWGVLAARFRQRDRGLHQAIRRRDRPTVRHRCELDR
jgi:flagellin